MTTYQISCVIGTTDPTAQLGLTIYLDSHVLFNSDHVTQTHLPLTFDLEEDEAKHELQFVMKNKSVNDTVVDKNGNIVRDARLIISNLTFEEIALNQIFIDHAVYTHDFNGSQNEIKDKFYGEMGCNGTVSLEYTTPVYLWFLENM